MNAEIAALCEDPVFRNFYQISRIPRGSGNEQAVSDFLLSRAKELGLDAVQDEANNVFIRKPASPGYENAPAVMLQAHMDMVCEKAEGVDHDFTKDPIDWVICGETLSTGGKTTLGADDGIGVALALALLEDASLRHPALEVLFTTMEEEDLSGAERFDVSVMRARYLINLDHVNDTEILSGSCGGMQADVRIPLALEAIPRTWKTWRLTVSGLRGGHSGEDIARGRGSANSLLARLLMEIESCCAYRLSAIKGGTFRLAIPREAEAVVCFAPAEEGAVRERLAALEAAMRAELAVTAEHVKVRLEEADPADSGVSPGRVIDAVTLMPDGIYQMNELFPGLVDTSDNVGEIYLEGDTLHMVAEIRSARDSLREYLFRCMERLASLLGGTCEGSNAYPGWEFHRDSPLRTLCGSVYQELFQAAPEFLVVHAGLEVGCFFKGKKEIDAVSIGPNCRDFHSPSETLEIPSVKKVYRYLGAVLTALK